MALVAGAGLLAGGCFPHEPKKRMYAEITEGAFIAGGIAMLSVSNSGADCDVNQSRIPGVDTGCHNKEGTIGSLGLGLIVLGLVGFISTISTAEEEKTPPPVLITAPPPAPTPVTSPIPLTPPPAAGSAATPATPAATPATDAGSATPAS